MRVNGTRGLVFGLARNPFANNCIRQLKWGLVLGLARLYCRKQLNYAFDISLAFDISSIWRIWRLVVAGHWCFVRFLVLNLFADVSQCFLVLRCFALFSCVEMVRIIFVC